MKPIYAAALAIILLTAVPLFEPSRVVISGDDAEPILAPLPAPKISGTAYATATTATTWTTAAPGSNYICATNVPAGAVITSTTQIPVVGGGI